MVGRNPGRVTSQGEILADLLRSEGFEVQVASTAISPYWRLAEIAWLVLRRGSEIDLLLVQTYGGRSFLIEDLASAIAVRMRVPVIFHMHGGAMPAFIGRFPRWAARVLSRHAAVVAPSTYLADALRGRGINASVIPNVIDLPNYRFRSPVMTGPRLLWMRSFHPLYNPAMAIDAFARTRAVFPAASLTMAGQDNGLEANLRARARAAGFADAVEFPGFLSHEDKHRAAEQADIFISTNHVDNAPVALIEAAAWGLPIVATDVGGVGHLVRNEESALLVPDGDSAAMAQAIIRLVRESALVQRLTRNARRIAESSDWSVVRPQWLALFARMQRRRSAASGGTV